MNNSDKDHYHKKTLAVLVGGGPAPGINGVIRSVTIEAINSGLNVIGIYDGFDRSIDCGPIPTSGYSMRAYFEKNRFLNSLIKYRFWTGLGWPLPCPP